MEHWFPSSTTLSSPPSFPPRLTPSLSSLFLSFSLSSYIFVSVFLSSASFFFPSPSWFTLTLAESSSLTTLHQMGHFPCSYCIPHYPIYFLLTLVPIRNYVYEFFFFTFLMSSHVDYNIEDSRDSLSLIHWWTFCSLSQNSCDCRKGGRGENFTSWLWFKGIKLLKYIELN